MRRIHVRVAPDSKFGRFYKSAEKGKLRIADGSRTYAPYHVCAKFYCWMDGFPFAGRVFVCILLVAKHCALHRRTYEHWWPYIPVIYFM